MNGRKQFIRFTSVAIQGGSNNMLKCIVIILFWSKLGHLWGTVGTLHWVAVNDIFFGPSPHIRSQARLECGTGPKSGSRSNFSVGQHNEKILLLDQVNAQWIIIHRTVSNF